ncbi:hypothetical protein JD844_004482 [Phrynosoma platyrhinos]|uniref:U3 small nucleolar RNA-associated protein 14 homolog A n=1 Tax=Phrynosoma platyrhinos TaxID=52577 RepID=A0ABQ7TMG8_PHRPL|nr:hypothetical protein JD844_004482 [Phrynosoma platyrhinos]
MLYGKRFAAFAKGISSTCCGVSLPGEEPKGLETLSLLMAALEEEEPEDDEEAAKRHRQLVDALSTLSGGKRLRAAERTEASRQISEFDIGRGADEKVLLSELLQSASATPGLRHIRKQLNKAQQKKAVQLPLSKEENERVVREAAYTQTAQALAKWDPVVQQNRRAEQLIFPLQQESVAVAPVEEVMSSWQARTPLEQEIFSLLHKAQQPVKDPLLTPQEKASLQAMSLEEVSPTPSRFVYPCRLGSALTCQYHRALRKGKSRKVLQEFEMLQKSNPEAALEQLEKMEKKRIEERMSLKHQNKGRIACTNSCPSPQARQAMQEQLARNKELTQKARPASESEEEGNNSEVEESLIPDVVNDGHIGMDPSNPWMLGKTCTNPREDLPAQPKDGGKSDEEEALLQSLVEPQQDLQSNTELQDPSEEEMIQLLPDVLPAAPPSPVPQGPLLNETLDRLCTLEDVAALEPEEVFQEDQAPPSKEAELLQPIEAKSSLQAKDTPDLLQTKFKPAKKPAKRKALIDLKAVLAEAPQAVQCPLVPTVVQDELDTDTDQRRVIREAFANDNVMTDFMKEKRRAEEADKPKAIDLVLPGWGEWGGTGLRPSAKKRRRFFIKPISQTQRRDKHLPHVILSEQRNISAAAHQVNQLPFPFENSQQFERSIQAPVGPTWNTQHAFQRLTAPRIITHPGHIIRPISAEDANLPNQMVKANGTRQKPDLELIVSPHKDRPQRIVVKKKKKAR